MTVAAPLSSHRRRLWWTGGETPPALIGSRAGSLSLRG